MKKLLGIVVLGLLTSCGDKVEDLKKETFYCSGKGGTSKIVNVKFSIDPKSKTLTFIQDGNMMGKLLNYPNEIIFDIKLSKGDKILTHDEYVGNFIPYIETDDKKKFYYGHRRSKYKRPPYVFKNCTKG